MAKVKITEPAQSDLEEIWQYIGEDNPNAANNLMDELGNKFRLLASQPELGRERQELMINLRAFPHKKFVVFYFLTDDGIEIFRVLHGSRDINQVFDEMIPGDSIN